MDWKNLNKKQKQNLFRLGLLAFLGIALLLAGGRGTAVHQNAAQYENSLQTAVTNGQQETFSVSAMEAQLAKVLSQVKGVGAVTVQITVYDLGRKEYARDLQRTERNSNDTSGDSRQQTTEVQESQTIVQQSGSQAGGALLVEETMPEICGVLIVAEGAEQARVQEQLLQAASTVLQISTEQIMVLPGEGALTSE